jgi:osmotically-inducible protein OsmY
MDSNFHHECDSIHAWDIIDGFHASITPESEAGCGAAPLREPVVKSDADLARSALMAIEQHGRVAAGEVSGVVRNGWLILEGAVPGQHEKRSFAAAVQHLDGIRGVSNNIAIESELLRRRVHEKITETLAQDTRFGAHRVVVTVSDKTVILSGCVRSDTERAAAEAAARSVAPTVSVANRVRVAAR